jgi:hypothetical protein
MVKTSKNAGSSADVSAQSAADVDELLRQAIAMAVPYVSRVRPHKLRNKVCEWEFVSYEIKESLYRSHTASGNSCSPQLQGHADLTLTVQEKSPYAGSSRVWRYLIAPKNAGLATTFQRLQQLRAWVSYESKYGSDTTPEYFGLVTDDEEFRRLASEQGYQVIFLRDGKLQTDNGT